MERRKAGTLLRQRHRRGVLAVRQPGRTRRCGPIFVVRNRRNDRHRAARRQSGDVAARGVDGEARLDVQRNLVQVLDLARALMPVLVEPKAPAVGVAQAIVARDERRDEQEAVAIRGSGQPPVVEHVVVGLLTAVQRHDHRRRVRKVVGDVDLVLPVARARVAAGAIRERSRGAGIGAAGEQREHQREKRNR